MKNTLKTLLLVAATLSTVSFAQADGHKGERARDLGWAPGYMKTGQWNTITDVAGVTVGQVTLIDPAKGMQTGVTAILPHQDNLYQSKVPAGFERGNGYGKMMGTTQVNELGEVETPIVLTNTLNVAEGAAGVVEWTLAQKGNESVRSVNAVVGETNDARTNDIRQRFVTKDHVKEAIGAAKSGPVDEGNVGAGTGTIAFGFKGGIGTSSRITQEGYTVGVLVQANYGGDLHIMGQPVGRMLKDIEAQKTGPDGSVMIIVATDAPLTDRNLKRLGKRALLGIGRTGGIMSNGSGDYVLAFSTAEDVRRTMDRQRGPATTTALSNNQMTPLFAAVIEATEEAVYNALVAAEDVTTKDGRTYKALPVKNVQKLLGK